MADTIDDAQAVNELHQEISLRNQRDKLAPETHPDFDGNHCVECGDAMLVGRLMLNRIRCLMCQERKEHTEKLFAGKHA